MEANIKSLLSEEIASDLEDLSSLQLGSSEYTAAVDDLVKLYKLKIEEAKIQLTIDERRERHLMEVEHRCDDETRHEDDLRMTEKQLKEQVKDRYFKLGLETAGLVLPLVFYACWMRKGFKFEETGTFTSTTFKGLFHHFRPTKK